MTPKSKPQFGIFIGYAPEQPIVNQGLGRLLAFLLQGLSQQNVEVIVAMPYWYREPMLALLTDFRINPASIEWLTTDRIPFLLKVRNFLANRRKEKAKRSAMRWKRFFYRLSASAKAIKAKIFRFLVRGFSHSLPMALLLLAFCAVIILITLPFLLIIFAFHILYNAVKFLGASLISLLKRCVKPALLQRLKRYATAPLRSLRNDALVQKVYAEVRANEFRKLTNKINKRNDVKAWLVPTLFWPEVSAIKAPKVMVVPDVVYFDFAIDYAPMIDLPMALKIEHSLAMADHYICYSEYVKIHHLVNKFSIPNEKITVVPHATTSCQADLRRGHYVGVSTREAAKTILRNHMFQAFAGDKYLRDFDLANSPYFLYTSQIRPHKNIPNLIKAYEKLLREELINTKLVLTGSHNGPQADWIYQYVAEKRLKYDVLFISNLSADVLAALNHLAVCSVNPTLFEGGFPFTFAEAYSVGTPSIMGRIPVTLEMMKDQNLADTMLFDPYDIHDICARMKWAAANREELFTLQAPLYEQLSKRTWKDVAAEYAAVLQAASLPAISRP